MRHEPVAMTSRRVFAGSSTALAVIGFSAALAIALIAGMHVAAPRDNGDVIGWITLHHYSKMQEQINFFGAIAIVVLSGVLGFALLRRFAGAIERHGPDKDSALFLASLAYVPGGAVFLVGLQNATVFTHPLEYAVGIVAAILAGHAVMWWHVVRREFGSWQPIEDGPLAVAPPGTVAVHRLLSLAIVFLTGAYCGWFLPNFFWFLPDLARGLAALGWLVPFVAVALYLWLSTKTDRAIFASLPAGALVIVPFVELHPALLVMLGVLVAGATWYVARLVVRDSKRFRSLNVAQLAVWLAVLGACIYPAYFFAVNPNIAHGQNVGALDGDNELAWLNDSLLGRLPYKHFVYPYGPLEFFSQYLPARLFGLDRFSTPLASSVAAVTFLDAAFSAAAVFVRPLGAVIAAPILFLVYGLDLRIWSSMAAFVAVLRAYTVGTRSSAVLAGVLYGIGVLVAPEFVGLATLASALLAGIIWFDLRSTFDLTRGLRVTAWIAAGAAIVLVPALGYLAARGMLVPYIDGFLSFIGVLDRCCGVPYPPMFDAGGLAAPSGTGFLWLLDVPRFRLFYLPAVVYGVAFAYLVARRALGGSFDLKERYLLGIALYGTLMFRVALGRSDEGHVSYASLQAGFVVLLLSERAILAGWGAAMALLKGPSASLSKAAANFCVVAGAFAVLVLSTRVIDVFALVKQRVPEVSHALQSAYGGEIIPPPDRVAPTTGWRVVLGPHDEEFLFRNPPADDMERVLAYLRPRLKPDDRVYAVPYESRYELLLGRPTPVDFGPELWSAATHRRGREQLVGELRHAKPRFIIYDETEWPDADGVSWLDRYPEIAHFLFSDYHAETVIGRTVVFAIGARPAAPDQLRLADFSGMPNLLSGWYYPQEIDGRDARWMSTEAQMTLARHSDQSDLSVELLGSGTQHRTLTITVNGDPLEPIDLSGTTGWHVVHEVLPPGIPAGRPLPIRLNVDTPIDPPISNRIFGTAIARVAFENPAQRRVSEVEALHAVASPPPRASFDLLKVDDRGPAPSVAYRGSIALSPGSTIDEVFVSFDGIAPARATHVQPTGTAVSFSGTIPLNDVSPGRNIVALRALALTGSVDSLKVTPVAEYEQIVYVPGPRRGSPPAIGPFDRSARLGIDLIRTQEGSQRIPASGPVVLARGHGLTVSGWAVGANERPISRMIAVVDNKSAWPVTSGIARPDVVASGLRNALRSGFYARLPATALPDGDHSVRLLEIEPKGTTRLLGGVAVHVTDVIQSWYIDAVDAAPFPFSDPHAAMVARRYEPFRVTGWAVDAEKQHTLAGVKLLVDGRYLTTAKYGIDRPDVAAVLNTPAYAASGFQALASLENVTPGSHDLQFAFQAQDGSLFLAERSVKLIVK